MKRTTWTVCLAAVGFLASSPRAVANELTDPTLNVALQWNDVTVFAIKTASAAPTVASRALFMVHSAIYNAWTLYDSTAVGTLPATLSRVPEGNRTPLNKNTAISYAAYRTLLDLFPSQRAMLEGRLADLGYNPNNASTDPSTPVGIGNLVAAAVLEFCHKDGSNQLGDLGGSGPYTDYTDYQAVNFPEDLVDPGRWQPLRTDTGGVQRFLSPHWGKVTPFALKSAEQFRPGPPPKLGTWLFQQRLLDAMRLNAELDDRKKMSAEYWDDFVGTDTPPGHWNRLAQDVSIRDNNDLDKDVKMFFALNAALHDVSISVWEAKRVYDYVRPVSAIRHFFKGQAIQGWGGKGKGITSIDGSEWQSWIATPPHPEFPSGHSAYSNAAAEILRRYTGSDPRTKPFSSGKPFPRSPRTQPGRAAWQEFTSTKLISAPGFWAVPSHRKPGKSTSSF
jgi:hypothetical protein